MKVPQEKIDEIKATLLLLPAVKQKEIIDFVLASKLTKVTSNRNHQVFYDELVRELKDRTAFTGGTYPIFTNKPYYKQFKDGVDNLDMYLKAAVGTITIQERMKFYRVISSILANRAMETDVPLSLRSLTNLLVNAPGLIDFAFPGYAASGLLKKIVLSPKHH